MPIRPVQRTRHTARPGTTLACMQSLESRRLLSAAVAPLIVTPTSKIDSHLLNDVNSYGRTSRSITATGRQSRFDSAGRVQVYIHTTGDPQLIVGQLRSLGAMDLETNSSMRVAEAFVPGNMLNRIAKLSGVKSVGLPDYAFVNSVTSAGDGIHKADQVRSQFAAYGIDGTGIKVGVISDGADNIASVGSELPTVTVDPSHPGDGNEGTAMLEIVHDLAPGAQLYFSGPSDSLDMVASINYLVAQGCNVIVDDLSFFGESFFSDSSVAQAAASAVASGVVYVTASGNYSYLQHYQASFLQGNSYQGGRLQRFKVSPNDDTQDIVLAANGGYAIAFLQWSDPWGTSSNDYNLYMTNSSGSVIYDRSETVQDGGTTSGIPLEWVGVQNNGSTSATVYLRIVKKNAAASRELELFTYGTSPLLQYATSGDALVGQAAVTEVLSTAAARATNPTTVEYFSSQGGSTIYTNFTTQTKTVRQTLDGTAIDGVQTQVGASGIWPNNPFYGTSAAAPHAAAIAALLRQANPSLTPAQVLQAMADTATDMGVAGYDTASGAGLYNALDAVYKVFTPAVPDLDTASDTGTSSSDDLTNNNLPTFDGSVPAGSYVRLFVDGVQSNAIQLGAGVTTYSLAPGAPLSDGAHAITLRIASSSSVALANNSNMSAGLNVTIDTVGPALVNQTFNYSSPFQYLSFSFDQSITGLLDNTDLVLTNSYGTPTIVPSSNIVLTNPDAQTAQFTFINYPYNTLPDGIYQATISASAVTDAAGNPLTSGIVMDFYFLNGDLNHDGRVDIVDMTTLTSNWNTSPRTFAQGDATYDAIVNVADLLILARNWQKNLFA